MRNNGILVAGLGAYALLIRWLPYVLQNLGVSVEPGTAVYPWNFSPMMAITLFSAALFSRASTGYALPLGLLAVSDLGIGLISGHPEYVFHNQLPAVYLGFALGACLSRLVMRPRTTALHVLATGLAAEVVFFGITNFAVWLVGYGGVRTYSFDLAGLVNCYIAGLPFFRLSLVSTLVYSAVLYGVVVAWRPHGLTLGGRLSEARVKARVG